MLGQLHNNPVPDKNIFMTELSGRTTKTQTPLPRLRRCKDTVWCNTLTTCFTTLCPGRCSSLLLIAILALIGHATSAPVSTLPHNTSKTYDNNGIICFKCGPGTFVVKHCTEDFTSSECEPCPAGHFQSSRTQAPRCEPCRRECLHDENMIVFQNCSTRENLKCQCKSGYYRHVIDVFMDHHICRKHTLCPTGQVIVKDGTSTSDTECDHCPDGQFYNSLGQCETCTICSDRNMTQLAQCNSTADAVCQTSHTTELPNMKTNATSSAISIESNDLWPVIVVSVVLLLLAIIVIVALCYCKRYTGKKNIKSIELYDFSPSRPMLERSLSSSSTSSSRAPKRQRTLSSGSVASTVTESAMVSSYPELQDRTVWTPKVFDLLSKRLSKDWQRFMRLLPGDQRYIKDIECRCDQIAIEEQRNVPEQIYKSLREWSAAHDDTYVRVDSVLNTLSKLDGGRVICDELLNLCIQLATEQRK